MDTMDKLMKWIVRAVSLMVCVIVVFFQEYLWVAYAALVGFIVIGIMRASSLSRGLPLSKRILTPYFSNTVIVPLVVFGAVSGLVLFVAFSEDFSLFMNIAISTGMIVSATTLFVWGAMKLADRDDQTTRKAPLSWERKLFMGYWIVVLLTSVIIGLSLGTDDSIAGGAFAFGRFVFFTIIILFFGFFGSLFIKAFTSMLKK